MDRAKRGGPLSYTQLVRTIDGLLDRARFLPPRNVNWVTLKPSMLPEESVVDAAFLLLAFHQYKSLPSISPALREAIAHAQYRFNFASFACPHRLAGVG